MKHLIVITAGLFLFGTLPGCSSNEKQEQPTIEEQMEQVGHNAAEEIKTTINKAEIAGQLQEAHNKTLEEAAKEQ